MLLEFFVGIANDRQWLDMPCICRIPMLYPVFLETKYWPCVRLSILWLEDFLPQFKALQDIFVKLLALLIVVLSALTYSGTCYSLKGMCLCYWQGCCVKSCSEASGVTFSDSWILNALIARRLNMSRAYVVTVLHSNFHLCLSRG